MVYTTHSPFLVCILIILDGVRIVEDKSMESASALPAGQEGTKVTSNVLDVSEESLFPLQGAMGFGMAQALFVGPNSLIVEGVSDLLYLQAMSAILQDEGRKGLRREWIVTPVGGADKVPSFAALFGVQPSMNVATLIDLQKKDQQQIDNLYRKKLLEKNHVYTYADFTQTKEADVEDMFDPQFYVDLLNAEFGTVLPKPVELVKLPPHPRITARVETYFKANPLSNDAEFNHYRPARYFMEHLSGLKAKVDAATKDRFEQAFTALNALLPKP